MGEAAGDLEGDGKAHHAAADDDYVVTGIGHSVEEKIASSKAGLMECGKRRPQGLKPKSLGDPCGTAKRGCGKT